VFLGAFLTGLGVYDKIGKYGGAGSIIPITGFANSIVASAMEFKREGYVYGLGARLFTVAGPVLVFGFIISVLIGLCYYYFS
ncbi:MAG: SpoVA/SpoVAEb family sporulation membrane protein, partial [Syntrophomonadaceae bacterium]|nr:SpoVA/SpoVAEb family sporulation membrane protein [Syntrophomonadaceae bacterium]